MKKKIIIVTAGLGVLLWDLLFITQAFISAYLNPAKTYTMNINKYNEAIPELILVLVLLPLGLFVVFDIFVEICKGRKENA